MYKKNPAGFPAFNPFVNPTLLPNGRVFVPLGKPHYEKIGKEKYCFNPYKKIDFPDYAQIFIGRKVNVAIARWKVGQKIPEQLIRERFKKCRIRQIGKKDVGATFISQKGYYEGIPEHSLQIIVMFFPSKGEKTFKNFLDNILDIADILRLEFGQETVYTNFYRKGVPYKAFKVF
jgi:hypothetical protein